jgi:hypothetical protein
VSIEGNVIRRGTFDTVFDGEGEWSNADIPLNGGNSKDLKFAWEVPTGAGNDIQNQEAVGDITINLNQQEEAFADVVVENGSGGDTSSIQDAVDAVPENGVVLVRNGTYNEAISINKNDVTIASKNGAGSTTILTSAASQNNRGIDVNGNDGVTIDGLTVTFDNEQPSNSEKYAIRSGLDNNDAGPDGLTVRNCIIEDFDSADVSTNTGAIRAVGIAIDMDPTGSSATGTTDGVIITNNTIDNIRCVGDINQKDSRAEGVSMNGDVKEAVIARNDITNIGVAGGSSEDPNTAENVIDSNIVGTGKPRGIDLTEGDNDPFGPRDFTILDNLIQGVEGTFGQPAIFIGGSNSLGSDHQVYNNEFHHPVDNLGGGALKLRQNTWVNNNAGLPQLVPPDQDEDGGNLIDRGSGAYDTTYTI